ncbi:MAG: prepilin-type N-terminal cleavage/methylation domain-containing protein [Candidatus Paceibacterota bacterium]
MFKYSNIKKSQSGFTIMEVLVTSAVFSIIALTVASIFVQTLALQRRASAAQKIQDNALFVLESMSRDIRVSLVADQESPDCTATTLTINHPTKGDVIFRLNNGAIEKSQAGGSYVAISGSDVRFARFNFCITGSLSSDNLTPRIAILTTVENVSGRETLKVNLQTTVSSRDVGIEFQSP